MPWSRETRRRDIPIRYRSERAAILAVRNQQGSVFSLADPRLMTADSPRVVCQHRTVDVDACPAYEHTTEAIMASFDADPGF